MPVVSPALLVHRWQMLSMSSWLSATHLTTHSLALIPTVSVRTNPCGTGGWSGSATPHCNASGTYELRVGRRN
ncbi:hypothetical protein ASPCADRAFT_203620 [Aspergillus carbonarius ITEM 5010]|uniref:Uncharacterized protein n=1 Tax=Aspergillus carbonarius (strain ITEM 5010) TaxID=602072 RepID=A0A1R3RZD0_ASPC5|nr:hypothetical protein ASPCADRAFT_203620 [Aspergillus carbonarius ITEM 5010]